jgi:hypothetical protein
MLELYTSASNYFNKIPFSFNLNYASSKLQHFTGLLL